MHRFRRCLTATGIALSLMAGCSGDFSNYLTESLSGNINLQFVNNTHYRASFTYGSFNDLDRTGPGPVDVGQERLEANTVTSVVTVFCRRDFAVATQDLVDRIVETNSDQADGFDRDALNERVNFSSAPIDDPAAALPSAGTAKGVLVHVGVDFACNDTLIFTFNEDPNAPGGFRIDYVLLHSPSQ